MTFSKFSFVTTLALTTLLTACSATVDEDKKVSDSTQFAEKVIDAQGNISILNSTDPRYTIKSLKLYDKNKIENLRTGSVESYQITVQACFSTNINRPVNNKIVKIYDNQRKISKVDSTDTEACIYLSESIDVEKDKKKHYKKFIHTVNFEGSTLKPINVGFAFNPYEGSFVRLDRTSINLDTPAESKFSVNDTIVMSRIRFTPKGYGKEDPRNDNNVIDKPFVANTCFNIRSNNEKMKREKIDVMMINKETGRVMKAKDFTLDESGCAEVSFSMLHERYTNTRRIPFQFIVKANNPKLKGAVVERDVCLYPWSNSGWVFGHDTISGPCPADSKDQRARIFLDEVNYTFLGHDQETGYHLNKNLDLVMVKSYVVNMWPKIDYGNFVHHLDPTEPLYQGDFRLKVLFLAPTEGDIELTPENYKKFKVISATSKIVTVEAKRLKARIDMPIKFNDIPYVHTRTYAVVKLEPVEETENSLLPAIAAGTFHASSKSFRSILHTQVDIDDVITKEKSKLVELRGFLDDLFTEINDGGQAELITYQLGGKSEKNAEQNFIEHTKSEDQEDFVNMTLSAAKKKIGNDLKDSDYEKLMNDSYSYDTMKKLCRLLFDTKKTREFLWMGGEYADTSMRKCIKNPEEMLNISAYSHIQNIAGKPEVKFSNTISIHKGTGKGNFHGISDRIGTSRRINAGLSISAKKEIFGILSVGAGGGLDVSKMWGHDMQTGNSNREDTGHSINLYADMISLEFDAITNKCVTIEGTYKYERTLVDADYYKYYAATGMAMGGIGPVYYYKKVPNKQRLRICSESKSKERLTESWYYLGEGHQFNTILRDRLSIKENKYMVMIRGKKNMARFAEFFRRSNKEIFMKKVKNTILPDTYMQNAFTDFKSAFDKDHDLVSDMAIPGTVEKYDALENGDDQFYGELPVEDFNPLTSPFGTSNK